MAQPSETSLTRRIASPHARFCHGSLGVRRWHAPEIPANQRASALGPFRVEHITYGILIMAY